MYKTGSRVSFGTLAHVCHSFHLLYTLGCIECMGYMICMEGVWGVHAHSAQAIGSYDTLVVYSKTPPVCTYMYVYMYNTEMCTCARYMYMGS